MLPGPLEKHGEVNRKQAQDVHEGTVTVPSTEVPHVPARHEIAVDGEHDDRDEHQSSGPRVGNDETDDREEEYRRPEEDSPLDAEQRSEQVRRCEREESVGV